MVGFQPPLKSRVVETAGYPPMQIDVAQATASINHACTTSKKLVCSLSHFLALYTLVKVSCGKVYDQNQITNQITGLSMVLVDAHYWK